MNVADLIADQFYKAGIRHIFGVPGGASIPWIEAFKNAGIEFILTTGEAGAGIMADVTSRLTGIPGICHATFGPGAANISTGTGYALLDRSSVIVLTSEMDELMKGRTTQMNIDHQELFRPLTKATFRLNPDNAANIIPLALEICREEYPGPVHIGLPAGTERMDVNENPVPQTVNGQTRFSNDTEGIISLLKRSRRPLIAAGLTAQRLGTDTQLRSFLDKYDVPLVITPMAKGIINENHPSYAGVLFHALSDYLEDLYAETDLIIGIGYDPVEYNYESWIPRVPLIHFDTKYTDMPSGTEVIQFAGKPEDWFGLLNNLNIGSLIHRHTIVKGIRDEILSVFEGFTGHFGPVAAMKILKEELPCDAIISADVGSHLHLLGQYWETGNCGKILMSNGWSGMGFGIPAAIAASFAKPLRRSICITGDGGFLMSAGELMTARRNNIPVIVIVFSDGELNLIRLKQTWKDIRPYASSLYHGDLFGSDIFMGIKVMKASSHEEMTKSIRNSLVLNEPVIINAIIDPDDYKWLVVKK